MDLAVEIQKRISMNDSMIITLIIFSIKMIAEKHSKLTNQRLDFELFESI
jgi:hypothetical protein